LSALVKRRVVVTGIGLVSGLGTGTEKTWEGLKAGKSGIGPITQFDAADFACRFAGEVREFDPSPWIEKKEVKKLARFMMFAIAASEEALEMAGLKITPDNAEDVGVYIGSGEDLSVLHSGHDREPGERPYFHPHRRQRAEFGRGHRLHYRCACHWRFIQDHPARRRDGDDLRRG
jgi:3-oxoacyl-(acyl-carrier-protein) synthase